MDSSQENLFNDASDDEILEAVEAEEYKSSTKECIVEVLRRADGLLTTDKKHGESERSVKGIVLNLSTKHHLDVLQACTVDGVGFEDRDTRAPSNAGPLACSTFFHGSVSKTHAGCSGKVMYKIVNEGGMVLGLVGLAWALPWTGNVKYRVVVLEAGEELLADYLLDVNHIPEGGVVVDGDGWDNRAVHRCITVNTDCADSGTAYVLVSIKTDEMVEAFGDAAVSVPPTTAEGMVRAD